VVGLLLLATVIVQGSRESEVDSKLRELEIKVKKLEQTTQLKIEGITNEAGPTLTTVQQSTGPAPVQLVRPANFSGGNCEQYRGWVSQYSWNTDIALAVMYAESGCNPNAISPTNDHGLFQLHNIRIYGEAENIAYAYNEKYMKGGWKHWVVCTKGIVDCW